MSFALIFPGQGSQSSGMLAGLATHNPEIAATFEEAADVLGYDLWAITQDEDASRLSATTVTQPALLTASYALWRVWQARGLPTPSVLAGHSLGEYSALVCAGVLSFTDAVALVEQRGKYMQQAVPEGVGAMAAILGLDDEVVVAACADVPDGVVAAVNFNAPGQVVIAGDKQAVEAAIVRCKEAGARRALPLPVSVPSHCSLMEPAADKMAVALADVAFSQANIPVVNNVDVEIATSADAIRDALVRQLHNPVRWVETMRAIGKQAVDTVFECGPGKVLCGLQKRIDRKVTAMALETQEDLGAAQAHFVSEG